MDLKSLIIGSVLSLSVGSGIYGLYLRTASQTALSAIDGLTLIAKCVEYNSSYTTLSAHKAEIDSFLATVNERLPKISKGDASLMLITALTGESTDTLPGTAPVLQKCVQDLKKNIDRFRE